MIQRGRNPYQGFYAFPGGFIEYGEDPKTGCFRGSSNSFQTTTKNENQV